MLMEENQSPGSYDEGIPSPLWFFFGDILPPDMTLYEVVVRPRLADVSEGWRDRVALHQLYPLLAHVALFGGGYAGQTSAAAARVLEAS